MVKQRLVSNFENILRAKSYFFLKKSIWKYLILTGVMGFSLPINGLNPVLSGIIYFIGVMCILWPLQYLSAKKFSKVINFDALVEFGEDDIKINHSSKEEIETQDWNWVNTIELKKDRIWLTLNQPRPFAISIPNSKLTPSEIDFFKQQKLKKDNPQ